MTLTVRTIVTDALRDAGLVDINRTPDSVEADSALSMLNRMALAWPAQGIHTGWAEVTVDSDFPLEDMHREGVTAMLVEKLAAARGGVTPDQKNAANRGYSLLAADFKVLEPLRVEPGLQGMPSQRWYW